MSMCIKFGKYVTVGDKNFTKEYNDYFCKPIEKYYAKSNGKAGFPLVAITSKCMRIGMGISDKALQENLSTDCIDARINEAAKLFYTKEDSLIKSLPVTYYTRNKKKLMAFLHEAIIAGMLFYLEVVIKLNSLELLNENAV